VTLIIQLHLSEGELKSKENEIESKKLKLRASLKSDSQKFIFMHIKKIYSDFKVMTNAHINPITLAFI